MIRFHHFNRWSANWSEYNFRWTQTENERQNIWLWKNCRMKSNLFVSKCESKNWYAFFPFVPNTRNEIKIYQISVRKRNLFRFLSEWTKTEFMIMLIFPFLLAYIHIKVETQPITGENASGRYYKCSFVCTRFFFQKKKLIEDSNECNKKKTNKMVRVKSFMISKNNYI